jgi:porin
MVRQIVVTALIAAGNLWPSLAASQTVTPLWRAAPERSADASTRRDDATCREATFATDSAQAQKSSEPSANLSPLVLSATYIGQAAGNPRGGVRQDIAYAGRLLVSSAVDLDRFIQGGTLRVWFTNRQGRNLADFALGTSTGVQEIYSPQGWHLSVLSYEQTLFDGRLELEAGRTPANVSFFSSPLCGYLQTNSACGSPTFLFKTSNLTYFPPSSWGARVKARLSDRDYVHVGVYEVNPERTRPGATGLEWSVKNATGVIVPFQFGYTTASRNEHLHTFQIGGWYDAAKYSDPVDDDLGGLAVLSGHPHATRHGRSGAYFSVDQVVWRPAGDAERSLRLFGLIMAKVSGRVNEDRFLQFGLVQTGTFPGRRTDSVAFVINDQTFSRLALHNIRAARASRGNTDALPRHQIMMELAYGIQINVNLRISPNIHYIINPDQLADPFRTQRVGNVLAIGLRFAVEVPLLKASRGSESAQD